MNEKQKKLIAEFHASFAPFLKDMKRAKVETKDFKSTFEKMSDDVERHSRRASTGLGLVRKAAVALGGTAAIYGMQRFTDQAKAMDNQLRAIGAGSDVMKQKIFALAIETRTPIEATVGLLRSMQKSLKDQSLDQTIRQVGTLNRLLTIGGLNSQARGSVALQFGQALQSGVLAGDELRSLREAAPVELLEAIAAAAGGTVADLRKLGAAGELTRDVMVQALEDLEQESREKFGDFKMTITEAAGAVTTALLATAGSFDEGLGITDQIAASLQGLSVFMLENADAAVVLGEAFKIVGQAVLLFAGTRGLVMLSGALQTNIALLLTMQRTMGATAIVMKGLGSIMALFGGPWGAAIFAAGGAFLALQGAVKDFNETMEDTRGALNALDQLPEKYDSITNDIQTDLQKLKEAQMELAKAIEAGGDAAVLAADREVQAIEKRLTKNRELLALQIEIARDNLATAQSGLASARSQLVPAFRGDRRANPTERTGVFSEAEQERRLSAELDRIRKKDSKDRSDREREWLRNYERYLTELQRLKDEEVRINELTAEAINDALGVRQTGGDASAAEEVFRRQQEKAEDAAEASAKLLAQVRKIAQNRDEFEGLEMQVETVRDLLNQYSFDDDQEVRMAVQLVSEALADAKGKVDELDQSSLEKLADQVRGLLDLFNGFTTGIADASDGLDRGSPRRRPTRARMMRNAGEAASSGIFDLIGFAEGTDKGRGYNETLGYGKLTGGNRDLVNMTLREILALQKQMLKHPDNRWNSSALGRYQIVGTTLGGKGLTGRGGLINEMGLSLDDQFTPELQDRMAAQLVRRRRGQGVEGMRNEWEGLRRIPGRLINDALGNEVIPRQDADMAERIKDENEALKEQADIRRDFNMTAEEAAARRELDLELIGKTASEQAYLTTKFELLNQAKKDGIDLDEKVTGSTRTYREEIERLSKAARDDVAAQEERSKALETAAQRTEFLEDVNQTLKDGLLDAIVEGDNFADTLENVAKMLARATLEAALFGTGPFAGGGGGGGGNGGGGWLSGLASGVGDWIGSLFGGATASANGNIMTGKGPVRLNKYAMGGIANSPQLSIFGEGDTPEAYVPLPDGRTIPVTLRSPDTARLANTPPVGGMGGGGMGGLQVNIYEGAASGDDHEVDYRPNEGRVDIRLRQAVGDMIAGGELDKPMANRFGSKPTVRGR